MASPIFAKPGSRPLCPTLIQVGSIERVRDDGLYFYSHAMPNEPIRLEVFQDSVHFFQMFADIDQFSNYALMRIGHFCREFTNNERIQPMTRQASLIYNSPNHPYVDIPDVDSIIADGVDELLKNGVWKLNDEGDVVVTNLKKGGII